MARVINVSDSITVYPSGIDTSQSSYSTASNNANAYDNVNSTDYSTINCNTGSRASSYVTYTFDVDGIPTGATINSVVCQAKARISSTSYISTATLQLYSGTTAKGSTTSFRSTSTSTIYTLSPGTWTLSELENIRIRATATRGTSNTSRSAYIYFYGADLTINYSVSGTAYTVVANSLISEITVSPDSQEWLEGESAEVRFDGSSINDILVTDNDTDVTSSLVQHTVVNSGSVSKVAVSYDTGGSINSGSQYASYPVGYSADNPHEYTSNMYSSSGNTGYVDYEFDFSDIPSNATITNITVRVNGRRESSTTDSTHIARIELYSGSTLKSVAQEFTSTADHIITIDNPGSWTRSELQSAIVRFTIGYYGGRCYGISWDVDYTLPTSTNQYYWTYTLTNLQLDHVIIVDNAGVYIPPDEDPDYTYWPITISSINATTNPGSGTTRVIEGTNQTITISPSDPLLTLALDNGVDITSQLVGGIPNNTYTINTQVSGADYGFYLNQSTGYYVSSNDGVSKSASVARINLDLESDCLVTLQYINYAEAEYDYGMFGKVDTAVATDGLTASSGSSSSSDSTSNYQYICNSSSDNTTTAKTLTYTVSAGQHFIDVKYGKDDASDSGNDNLQWKVLSVEATSAGGDYTYTLNNINQNHSVVFVFGDVTYYFVNSSSNDGRLFPEGQQVKLPGDSYKLNIIPDNIDDVVTITDNSIDMNVYLEREDGVDKNGNPVVSYGYSLNNIQATHNIVVTITGATTTLYFKNGNTWTAVSNLYFKENGTWVRKPLTFLSDNHITLLRRL